MVMLLNPAPHGGHGTEAPSAWVRRWAGLARPDAAALDLACGRGRHSRYLLSQGLRVLALDRDEAALAALHTAEPAACASGQLVLMARDIEQGEPDAVLPPGPFDLIVVTHYLWRPLWPTLLQRLAPGGVYLHETFADGQQTIGKPSRPQFLLQPGELLHACKNLRVVAFEDGFEPASGSAPGRFVQRIAAVRPPPSHADTAPARWALNTLSSGA